MGIDINYAYSRKDLYISSALNRLYGSHNKVKPVSSSNNSQKYSSLTNFEELPLYIEFISNMEKNQSNKQRKKLFRKK